MKIQCGNCLSPITLNIEAGTVSHTTKAHGRGSKRVDARTTTNTVYTHDGYLLMWDAPCCLDRGDAYADSYEYGGRFK